MQSFNAVVCIFDDQPDESGVIIKPGAVTYPREMVVTRELKGAVIGTASLSLENDGRLMAALNIVDGQPVLGLYPAIAGLAHNVTRHDDGHITLDEISVTDLTLTETANSDARIAAL